MGSTDKTLWSKIIRAGRDHGSGSQEALEWLCQTYWRSVYAFLRGSGLSHEQASDQTQGFFLYFLQKNLAGIADPAKGRFRNFLLGSLKIFLCNEARRAQTTKRGGGVEHVPLDISWEEGATWPEPSHHASPDREFDRRWALTVLEETLNRLAQEFERTECQAQFQVLRPFLSRQSGDYGEAARLLNKTEGTVRVEVSRLRKHYRQLIRQVIAETLANSAQVEDELQHLKDALRDE